MGNRYIHYRSRAFPRGVLIAACVLMSLSVGLPAAYQSHTAGGEVYIFSPDAKYVRVSLNSKLFINDVGNLWYMKIFEVSRLVLDPTHRELLVITRLWPLQGSTNPSHQEYEATGIVVLKEDQRGALTNALQPDGHPTVVRPPAPGYDVYTAFIFVQEPKKLFVTWLRAEASGIDYDTYVYDRSNAYRVADVLEGVMFYNNSCYLNGTVLIPNVIAGTVKSIDINTHKMETRTLAATDISGCTTKGLLANYGCLDAFTCRMASAAKEPQVKYFLYDLEKDKVIVPIELSGYADVHFVDDGKYLVADREVIEKERVTRNGDLVVYETNSGRQMASMQVPSGGTECVLGMQGNRGYYFSPHKLSMLDFGAWKVIGSLELPFDRGVIGILEGK